MNKFFLLSLGLFLISGSLRAQTEGPEPRNFSILGQLGMEQVSGFLDDDYAANPAPAGGLWLGVGLDDRFDGLWGIDYFTMPNQEVTVAVAPTTLNSESTYELVRPTDDIALSVNTRWYWVDKFDRIHQHFNTTPYLLVGACMDLVVDQDPAPANTQFYGKSYDVLFGLNLGGGIDFPLGDGKQWILYVEGLDHMIFWQGATQIYSGRVGIKVMLDSAHIDPFRGVF